MVDRVVVAIRKRIITNIAHACAGIAIRVDEPTDCGVIVAALEIVEAGFLVLVVATVPSYFLSKRFCDQFSILHMKNQISRLRNCRIMGNNDNAPALLMGELPQDLHNISAVLTVQVAGWLVG